MTQCTPRSLKKLEMPLLCQKLGFKNDLQGERITAQVGLGYSDRVLVGDWLERRQGCHGNDNEDRTLDLRTQYMVDYDHKTGGGERDRNNTWDIRLRAQGSVQLKEGDEDDPPTKMATIYDLAYRCRVRDFVSGDYGNVTNYGKKECLHQLWDAQADDRELRFHTEYKDKFSFSPCLGHVAV